MFKEKMTEKEKLYLKAKESYYNGNPIISDEVFDTLEDELKTLNSQIVQNVGHKTFESLRKKHYHLSSMLSLAKIKTTDNNKPPIEEFWKWHKKVQEKHFYDVTPKYDGNAVNIIYKKGILEKALTRGDGIKGLDITDKINNLVPKKIENKETIEVRGEILVSMKTFYEKYNDFKNPRNFVAGILNHKKTNKEIVKDLVFIPYSVRIIEEMKKIQFLTIDEEIHFLNRNSFKELPFRESLIVSSIGPKGGFKKIFKTMLKYREERCPYQLDGFVLKCSNIDIRTKLGSTDHHPEWALAVKFKPQQTVTTIRDIVWEIGKTGEFTPIALLYPVDLDGSKISRCTLHNKRYIENNKVFPGAEVSIVKTGDIIPQVEEVITPSTINYEFPSICPYCKKPLRLDDIHIYCSNKDCSGTDLLKFRYSINQLKMDFFGQKTIDKLFEMKKINSIFDIFDKKIFNKHYLVKNGFSDGKSTDRLLNSVYKIKRIKLETVILMMTISNLGTKASEQIARKFVGLDYSHYGLPKKVFESFNENQENHIKLKDYIKKLENNGITIEYPIKEQNNISKIGGTIELTGSPKNAGFNTKKEFLNFANKVGYTHSKLDKKSKFLVTDNYNTQTSKMKKASSIGIEIITYNDFVSKFS